MGLPNLSNMMNMGQIRHIQAKHEVAGARNPDTLVRHFLTLRERVSCEVRGRLMLGRVRRNPFYHYALARTRYYDELFANAIARGDRFILNIGCGGDTRAYRWREQLVQAAVTAVECDQRLAIEEKARVARRRLQTDHVQYMPIDLNEGVWPHLEQWLQVRAGEVGFVMLEGVSPYIDQAAFSSFLGLLSRQMLPGSLIAYDYKLAGVADHFGQNAVDIAPFRLGADPHEVAIFHAGLGLHQMHHELGSALTARMVSSALLEGYPRFEEDALVQVRVSGVVE